MPDNRNKWSYAQLIILEYAIKKEKCVTAFIDHWSEYSEYYGDYNDCHGDYYDAE